MSGKKKLTVAIITVGGRNGEQFGALSLFSVGPDQMYDPVKGVVIAKDPPANLNPTKTPAEAGARVPRMSKRQNARPSGWPPSIVWSKNTAGR